MKKIDYCSRIVINRNRKIQQRKEQKRKKMALLVSLLLLITITVGGTIAFIYTQTGDVENTFTPSKVTCDIVESFDGSVKSNVYITNTGDTEAYIRAGIIVNWIGDDENISAIEPVLGEDYSLNVDEDDNWIKIGDYYYHKKAVSAGASTETLIRSCEQLQQKEGYSLFVEIIGDAIQSTPLDAVKGSWNVKIADDGTITRQGGQ